MFSCKQAGSGIDSDGVFRTSGSTMSPAASSSLTGLYGGGGSHTGGGGGNFSPAATGNSSLLSKLMPAGGSNTPQGGGGMGGLCQTIEASELNLQRIVGSGAYGKVGEIPDREQKCDKL